MKKLSQIKNIIFDLGNVIVDINLNITIQHFKDMGWKGNDKILDKYEQAHFFGDYEQGFISSDAFIKEIQAMTSHNNSAEEIKYAWNALLSDFKKERIECIKKLSTKYNIFVLSNTNKLHIEECKGKVPDVGSLEKLFNKVYYSYEMHLAKPNKKIFEEVLADASILPEETLFLDDSPANIETAKKLGITTWLIEDSDAWVKKAEKELFI